MSSGSLNEILIKIPTELFDFIFAAYNLHLILARVVYICTRRDDARRIQQHCFIYCSIFEIPALRKRRVQGHCAVYNFRINNARGGGGCFCMLYLVSYTIVLGVTSCHFVRMGKLQNQQKWYEIINNTHC